MSERRLQGAALPITEAVVLASGQPQKAMPFSCSQIVVLNRFHETDVVIGHGSSVTSWFIPKV